MYYSQVNRDTPPIETVRCALSCWAVHLHIPKRSRYQSASNSPFSGRSTVRSRCKSKVRDCVRYLWLTRLSVQCNFVPCLIILALLFATALLIAVDVSNGHYLYHRLTVPLLYPSSAVPSHSVHGPSLYELHHKVSVHYPDAHVIAGPPLSKEDLGHLSWLFLHTQALTFPEEPTAQRQRDMVQFWESFSRLYPCGECAKHIRQYLKEHPPAAESQRVYSEWLCRFHNSVSKRVHPESAHIEDCDAERLLETWKPSAFCGCDNEFIEGVDEPPHGQHRTRPQ